MSFDDVFKQVQDMQARLGETHEALKSATVVGESGGGLVKITMNGRFEALRVDIDPAAVGDELSVLEDLIAAAVNDAARRVEGMQQDRLNDLARGLGLPTDVKLPF